MNVLFLCSEGFDYSSSQLTEGLHLLAKSKEINFKTVYKTNHHKAQVDDLETISIEDAADSCDWADLIIWNSGGDGRFSEDIRGRLLADDNTKRKRVLLDGHDSDALLWDPTELVVYYKREYRYPHCSATYHHNIRSFTFGVYNFLMDELASTGYYEDRDIDISFIAFGGSNEARLHTASVLKQINGQVPKGSDRSFKVYVNVSENDQPLSIDEYISVMRRSKIGISIPGAGLDTLRFWETMAHGAVLCSPDVTRNMVVRNAPEPHRHALYFDKWQDMAEHCARTVLNSARWVSMRRATDELLWNHTTTERARDFLCMFAEMA